MLDSELTAAQRRQQIHLLLVEQIVLLALETVVGLLLDDDDNISWCDTWRLVALAAESDSLAATHALVDVDLEHFLLRDDLAATASLALVLVVDDLASPAALVARLLELLNHRAHLAESDLDTTAGAGITCLDGTLFSTFAVALDTNDVAGEGELCRLALVEVLERDMYAVYEVFCLARALWT